MASERYPTKSIQRAIKAAVAGAGDENPAPLAELIGVIDAFEKTGVSAEELNEALAILIANGDLHELPNRHYAPGRGSAEFVPLTADDLQVATQKFHRTFFAAWDRLENEPPHSDEPIWKKLAVVMPTRSGQRADDNELDEMGASVVLVLDALNESGFVARPAGASVGPNKVEFAINARKDDDAARMLDVARRALASSGLPGATVDFGGWGE